MTPPKAFSQEDIQDKFWTPEDFDEVLPQPGWLTDFVLYHRGHEAPTRFCLWAGLMAVSMLLKRDCYLWDRYQYPNLFTVLVAPPRINAKGYIIGQAEKVWRASFGYMKSVLYTKKYTRAVHSSLTIQSISEFFPPTKETVKDEEGKYHTISKGTEVAFIIGELSTFLGKEKFNEGKIMKLTDFYDCKDKDDDFTISRGDKSMADIYVTILGGTTRGNLAKTIPEEAFSTGFMSRVILVDQLERLRNFPHPRPVIGGPKFEELARRLAYVAAKATGRYDLSSEAKAYYEAWYMNWFKKELPLKEGLRAEMYNRFDIHLLKIALILRAQRYEPGNEISLQDFKDAERLLHATYKQSPSALSFVGDDDFSKIYTTIRNKILKEGQIYRVDLVRHASAYKINANEVTKVVLQLKDEDNIIIKDERNTPRDYPSRSGKDLYEWTGDEDGTS